jgi:hypothetical protein
LANGGPDNIALRQMAFDPVYADFIIIVGRI